MFIPTEGVKLQEQSGAPNPVETHNYTPEEIDETLLANDDPSGDLENTDDSDASGKATDVSDADDEGGSTDDDKDDDLDDKRIPRRRLNAVIEERNTLREQLGKDRERMAVLEDRLLQFEHRMMQHPQESADYIDELLNNPDEQVIIDAINDEPRKFLGQLISRVRSDTAKELQQEGLQESYNRMLFEGLDEFAGKYDGFKDYMNDTSVHERIRRNPHHNVVSLYITEKVLPDLENEYKQTMEEAVKAAKKEARSQALKEVKAKRNASVLDGGSSHQPDTTKVVGEEDLQAAGGDKRTAILNRLIRRREGSA